MKLTKNFSLHEFIDPKTYKRFGNKSVWFIDLKLVRLCQEFRGFLNEPITINNWKDGGRYKYSGFRPHSAPYSKLSQHRFGRAADLKIHGITPKEVRKIIKQQEKYWLTWGLRCVEKDTPTWLHIDVRETNGKKILWVPYK